MVSKVVLSSKVPQHVSLARSHREALQTVWVTPQSCPNLGTMELENVWPLHPAIAFSSSSHAQCLRGSCSQKAHMLVHWLVSTNREGIWGSKAGSLAVYAAKSFTYSESHSLQVTEMEFQQAPCHWSTFHCLPKELKSTRSLDNPVSQRDNVSGIILS